MLSQVRLHLRAGSLLRVPPLATATATTSRWNALRWNHTQEAASPAERERAIHERLAKRFEPTRLQVEDVSGGCGTFYAITISSKSFNGLPTIKQHRLVNEELKDVIQNIHGLQLKTIAE